MGNVELTVFVKKTVPHVQGSDKPASLVAATVLMRASNTSGSAWQNGSDVRPPWECLLFTGPPVTPISLLWECYPNLTDSPICR
jgi:hypothetical protein